MTVAIAEFALSPGGRVFATVCDRWGVDPGGMFPDDDVLAFNLRAGLMVGVRHTPELVEQAPEGWEAEGEANRREWLAGARAAQELENRRLVAKAAEGLNVDARSTTQQTSGVSVDG
jgi:hypothetical protein